MDEVRILQVKISKPVEFSPGEHFKDIVNYVNGKPVFKPFLAGEWVTSGRIMDVRSPIDLTVIAGFYIPEWKLIDSALDKVYRVGRWAARNTPGEKRVRVIEKLADLMEERREELAEALIVNTGKPVKSAFGEVDASIDRLRRSLLDVRKIYGEYVPGDWDKDTLESEGIVKREPYGVVLAVIPFNYPLFDTVNKLVYSFIPR